MQELRRNQLERSPRKADGSWFEVAWRLTRFMTSFGFELSHRDATTSARRGVFFTPHGAVQTPAFMPVGTQGTVKGVTIDQVAATGAEMILGNTYHLALRPGHQTVQRLGGLHAMSGWEGPDPDRQWRFSSIQLGGNQQSHRAQRHVSQPRRRRDHRTHARTFDRNPRSTRQRRGHGAGSRRSHCQPNQRP